MITHPRTLFLNHNIQNCGVYMYGIRLYEILSKTNNIEYIYKEVKNLNEYNNILNDTRPVQIIYNWQPITMWWLTKDNIQKNVRNIGVVHEPSNLFDVSCEVNSLVENEYSIPRPIYENVDELLLDYIPSSKNIEEFINYKNKNIPVFGSFGFACEDKGFDNIVKLVNNSYDNAIIKFVMSTAHFIPEHNILINDVKTKCLKENIKPGIELLFIHEFFSNKDLIKFLNSNDMNIFLYQDPPGRILGISSVIDYAISIKKPLGISNSSRFRHIYSDNICLEKTSIERCLKNSVEYCRQFIDKYSHEKMIKKFQDIIL